METSEKLREAVRAIKQVLITTINKMENEYGTLDSRGNPMNPVSVGALLKRTFTDPDCLSVGLSRRGMTEPPVYCLRFFIEKENVESDPLSQFHQEEIGFSLEAEAEIMNSLTPTDYRTLCIFSIMENKRALEAARRNLSEGDLGKIATSPSVTLQQTFDSAMERIDGALVYIDSLPPNADLREAIMPVRMSDETYRGKSA